MKEFRKNIKGRGASSNTANRFDRQQSVPLSFENEEFFEDGKPLLRTQFLPDASRSIISENNSPDIPFRFSINPYRGCEHGCAYCYARPTHEYLGLSAGLDFESKIFVKKNAAELLCREFMHSSWQGYEVTISGNTDCYQPIERELKLTRQCLEVFRDFRNPLSIITKNALVVRDLDILTELASWGAVLVVISLNSLDNDLCRDLEPRTSRPEARLSAIEALTRAGIPVGINIAPVIPGLNDHEIPAILKAGRQAGALYAGYTPVRLPLAVAPLFEEWLSEHRPLRKEKVLSLIRDLRGGELNDSQFGSRMRGRGPIAAHMQQMFELGCRREGFKASREPLSREHFARPGDQMSLF